MFNKLMLSALGLMAAVTGPMVFFAVSDYWKTGRVAAAPAVSALPAAASASAAADRSRAAHARPPPGGRLPVQHHARLDLRRWPQVATGLGQLHLQGYRVPLVSGTAESDVAGSLTYYFNAQQQLQRIAFDGDTGDPRRLILLLRGRYQLTWRPTNDPALVVYEAVRSDSRPASALRIVTAPVVSAAEPRQRFELQLVLERPEE